MHTIPLPRTAGPSLFAHYGRHRWILRKQALGADLSLRATGAPTCEHQWILLKQALGTRCR